jgi:O-antigen/teichoic acid export membrane protein
VVGAMGAGVAGNFLALAAASADGIRLCRKRGIELRAARPAAFGRLFGFGWVMTVNSISGFLLYHVQRYLVGAAMGPAAVMVYQTAAVVPSKVHAVANAATEVLFPFSSASRDRTALRRVYRRMLAGSALVALMGFVALVALARPLLSLWLGASLAAEVAPLVPVFALAYAVLALSPAPFHLVNGLGRPGLNTVFYAMNALLNLALIAVFALSGLTLAKFAWAFALANVVTGLLYQVAVESLVWRRAPELSEVSA